MVPPTSPATRVQERSLAIRRRAATTLQLNLGRLCNQACRHCHVGSSPARSGPDENAGRRTIADVLELLRRDENLATLDLTGGAPELNPHFRGIVIRARSLGRRVVVRHNLTVQFEPGQDDLPAFFAEHGVVLFCSLPCYLEDNVARQRGSGVFEKSIAALRRLNAHGYGSVGWAGGPPAIKRSRASWSSRSDGAATSRCGLDREAVQPARELNLVFNPQGVALPPPQEALERDYRRVLRERYGVDFTRLVAIANQPIDRFRDDLARQGRLEEYHRLLEDAFNPATLDHVMCRSTLSVRWDGALFDCDFNLVQDLPLRDRLGRPLTLEHLLHGGGDVARGLPIAVGRHCFACTAGAGSSCGGALTARTT